ncbi:hypothetical protein PYW08_002032 [Mythimna loreyi]|uniref:Uncharacterized protein n=1 Tax=Mythimna loreyi TaxID=667449 RepID=A0ACC2R148_9NEOP|nr:hypothetical protein PYW08_002032 [Mythimna loreyi]
MFYPIDSLKRGGRFYLCWVADSWPLRFATITHRQLWSQDIRRICDDLLEVMTNESGRPTNRFSLRLSSQLLRGLVRLYQRKATILLGELCMINANVMKHSKKKWNIHEVVDVEDQEVRLPQLQPLEIREIVEEPPENEQRIEEMIQQSGNVVSNIADITLKEATIGEVLLPPNDGFGEENPEQALQFLQDRTLEQMLVQPDVSTVHSGLEVALDITDKSHDKSRLMHEPAQMERISEHDVTLFRKSVGEELIPEFEKDIPEIPEIPHPELPVPVPDKPQEEPMPEAIVVIEPLKMQQPVEIELEELEETAPQAKRRKFKNKLIIDKKTKISPNIFRARIENPMVELRCEDSSDDIILIRVPPETYFRRPCHGGEKILPNFGFTISRLFCRNLGVVSAQPLADREEEQSTEAVRRRSSRTLPRSSLENIEEEQEAHIVQVQDRHEVQLELPIPEVNVTANELNVSEVPRVSVPMDLDITEMLTQKVETLSQARKRTAEHGTVDSPKRQRSVGYVSFRESQQAKEQAQHVPAPCPVITTDLCEAEADKENVPANLQQPQPQDAELILSSKLQEAGLADIVQPPVPELESHSQPQRPLASRKTGSDRSETPLGSLDRTKVSLGDSEQTTDSKRFIRDQWGTEGTMVKILKHIKAGLQPVTVTSLLNKGPVISGYRRIIAARCFTSLLKLKQHGFINVKKNSETLEIADVTLGPKLTNLNEV